MPQSTRVWLGRRGQADRAQALHELFEHRPGETPVPPRDIPVLVDEEAEVRPDRSPARR